MSVDLSLERRPLQVPGQVLLGTPSKPSFGILSLPTEIIGRIITCLPVEEGVKFSQTCRTIRNITKDRLEFLKDKSYVYSRFLNILPEPSVEANSIAMLSRLNKLARPIFDEKIERSEAVLLSMSPAIHQQYGLCLLNIQSMKKNKGYDWLICHIALIALRLQIVYPAEEEFKFNDEWDERPRIDHFHDLFQSAGLDYNELNIACDQGKKTQLGPLVQLPNDVLAFELGFHPDDENMARFLRGEEPSEESPELTLSDELRLLLKKIPRSKLEELLPWVKDFNLT